MIAVALAAVLNSLWPALAIAATAAVALKFAPRINAATRYVILWAVVVVLLALPMAPHMMTIWKAPPASVAAVALNVPQPPAPIDDPAAVKSPPPARGPLLPFELRAGNWLWWIVAAWSAVFLFRLARISRSYRYLRGIKKRARLTTREQRLQFDEWLLTCRIRRPVQLLVSSEIASPMAVGFLRPAVILPELALTEFTEPELDHVLLHELAHIARRDDWTNLAARLLAAALALHPVAAWVLRRIEREREIACDDWVVGVTGDARPYAASLARVFELCWTRRRELLASGMAGRGSQLGERIEMLLRRGREFAPHASLASVALSAIVLLAFVILGAATPQWIAFAQEPPPPPAPPAIQTELQQPEPPPAPAPPEPPPLSHAAAPEPAPAPAAAPFAPAAPGEPPPQAAPQAASGGRTSFLAALVAAGYGGLSVDEIIELKNVGVTAEFISGISQSGWGKLTPKQLIDLRMQGVTPEYVRKMREAGLKDLTIQEVIDARMHGVRPESLQEIHALGFGPYTAKQAIEFTTYGVRTDLFHALKEAGFTHAEASEIIEAGRYGLRAQNLREAKTFGSTLTLKQIIRLKQAGVI